MIKNKNNFSLLNRSSGAQKLLFCLALSVCFFIILLIFNTDIVTGILFGWDFFCLSMITISWIIFFTTSRAQLHLLAKKQDENLPVIFSIIVVSVCFSLLGTIVLLISKDINFIDKEISSVVSLLGVAFSWMMLHTIFTMRYAHMYYEPKDGSIESHKGGLDFPKEVEPDYLDFAYFSFVIGMTFQVSDVRVTSRTLRKFVLVHGLISFVFNAIIVALTISIIANLKK